MEDERPELALSFDDVVLAPARSEVLPDEVDVSTRLTNEIILQAPLISAAMDMVTEGRLAIAIAREGGIGVIHKNLMIEEQATEVDKVKRSESGMIVDPVTLSPDRNVGDALRIMAKYHISGLPITEGEKLVGILTNRDLRFETDLTKSVAEAMTSENLVTTGEGTTLEEAKSILHKHRIEKLPVVDEDMTLLGLITIKDIEKVAMYPNATKDDLGRLRVAAAVGVGEDLIDRTNALVERGVDAVVLDSAHGHHVDVIRAIERLRGEFADLQIIGGNVATEDGAEDMIRAGVNAVKVGVGPGSICTTRVVSGAGVPQITAIQNAARATRRHGLSLIADGGIKFSGDITKAIAAGADCCMIGALFAGTEESPGETVLYRGRTYKQYRGMGSIGAMRERIDSRERYGLQGVPDDELVPQGIEGRVAYKGPVSGVATQLIGGLRAGMGYCGVKTIEQLQTDAKFYQVTSAGLQESHAHDVTITEEAPNYQVPE
ncbi:MAG: IMP dehydrogenase [Armatimonadota bacterium]